MIQVTWSIKRNVILDFEISNYMISRNNTSKTSTHKNKTKTHNEKILSSPKTWNVRCQNVWRHNQELDGDIILLVQKSKAHKDQSQSKVSENHYKNCLVEMGAIARDHCIHLMFDAWKIDDKYKSLDNIVTVNDCECIFVCVDCWW